MKKNKNVLAKIGELEDCILDYYSFKNTLARVGKLDNLIEEYYFPHLLFWVTHFVTIQNNLHYSSYLLQKILSITIH